MVSGCSATGADARAPGAIGSLAESFSSAVTLSTTMTCPSATLSPTATPTLSTTPAVGDGISMDALSLSRVISD